MRQLRQQLPTVLVRVLTALLSESADPPSHVGLPALRMRFGGNYMNYDVIIQGLYQGILFLTSSSDPPVYTVHNAFKPGFRPHRNKPRALIPYTLNPLQC